MNELEQLRSSKLLHVTLRFLKPNDAHQVQELCEDWFPVKYPRIWYKWITETDMFYALAALQGSTIIGLLVAQTKPIADVNPEDRNVLLHADLDGGNIGYILTLGVHKPYRRLGLASLLLNQYIEHVRLDYHIKCQSSSCPSVLADAEPQSQASEDSEDSIVLQNKKSSCASIAAQSTAVHYVVEKFSLDEVNANPVERPASRYSPVALASKSESSAHPLSSPVQALAKNNSSKENCTPRCNGLKGTSVPSKVAYVCNSNFQNDSRENPIFQGELKRQEELRNRANENELESLRQGSFLWQNRLAKTCGPVILNINVGEMSSFEILFEPSSLQEMTDVRDIRISISDSSDSAVVDKGTDLRLSSDVRSTTTVKSMISADINSNVLAQTYAGSTPVCAATGHLEIEALEQGAFGAASSYGVQNESTKQHPACGAGTQVLGGADGSWQTCLSDSHCAESVPTIYGSYVVESEVMLRDVLERLRCCNPAHADAPVTALLLHVLSSNSPAIAFYSHRKFTQLAFLPMFYTINDIAEDGYSYVFYLNGGEAPCSFFSDTLSSLALPGMSASKTFGSFSSVPARVAGTVVRWVLGDLGSHSNIVGNVLAGVVGALEKVMTMLVGTDAR